MKLLIDAYNVYHRARHTPVAKLTLNDGTPSGAVYGAIRTIEAARKRFDPHELILCWEHGGRSRRQELDAQYKADRSPEQSYIPEDHVTALLVWADISGFGNAAVEGTEADDVIAAICRHRSYDEDVVILSSDHDMKHNLQYPRTYLQRGKAKDPVYQRSDFLDEEGYDPEHYLDVLALTGDSSDNVEGLKGVGKAKATKMLERNGWYLARVLQEGIWLVSVAEKIALNRKVLQPIDDKSVYDRALLATPKLRDHVSLREFYEKWEFPSLVKALEKELLGV